MRPPRPAWAQWALCCAAAEAVGLSAAATASRLATGSGLPAALAVVVAGGLVVLGGAALGAGMGLVLGLAQAAVLRRAAPGWRWWPAASTAAWTPAMAVIFAGAAVPGATWPLVAVTATGALTGAAAGTVLGLVLAGLAPRLETPRLEAPGPR